METKDPYLQDDGKSKKGQAEVVPLLHTGG